MTLDKSCILKHAPSLVFAAILGVQLFAPPVIGLSNNGDFSKIMGLFNLGAPRGDEYAYVNLKYRFDHHYHWKAGYYSSETLLAAAPISLKRNFSKDRSFDLRWMGFVHGLLFVLAVYLLEDLLKDVGGWRWYVVWIAITIGFGDVMYVSYFNSVYMDAAAYLFLLLAVVRFLRAVARGRRTDSVWLVICVALLLLSKSQHAILGVWISPLFAFFGGGLWPGNGRLFAIVSATIVAATALVGAKLVPFDYAAHGYYSVIFSQILPYSTNVKADLEALGLDESYARFVGTHAYSAGSGFRDPAFADVFMQRTSYSRVGWYFLTHPRDAYLALNTSLGEGGRQRPPMGNFERSAQFPQSSEAQEFAAWSNAKRALFHGHGVRYGSCFVLTAVLMCWIATAQRKTLPTVLVAGVYAMAGMGITEMLIASLADAIDVTRHYLIAATILDLELLIVLVLLLRNRAAIEKILGFDLLKGPVPCRSAAAAGTLRDYPW